MYRLHTIWKWLNATAVHVEYWLDDRCRAIPIQEAMKEIHAETGVGCCIIAYRTLYTFLVSGVILPCFDKRRSTTGGQGTVTWIGDSAGFVRSCQSVSHMVFDTWDSIADPMLYFQNGHPRWAVKSAWSINNVQHIEYISRTSCKEMRFAVLGNSPA